jgi:ferric-dicitrate binding protein FerR (iron transport regulator)
LSDGEEILLKEKNTDLQFSNSGTQIKIDKDSVINYQPKADQNAMAQVVIPFGKRSNILLSDGTKVWLNAGSKLIFPQKFTGKNRKVFLKGEAYFDVFGNKNFPFIVSTDNMNVTVHGTKFNVKDNDSDKELEVVLAEGEVRLKGNSVMNFLSDEIKLKPNQIAIFNKVDNKTVVQSNVDVDYYTSWKEGVLKFNRESILTVFEGLSRYYNVRFVTENSVELNRKISGKLDLKESLEDVMKVISDAAPITFRIDKDKVFVSSKINYLPMR